MASALVPLGGDRGGVRRSRDPEAGDAAAVGSCANVASLLLARASARAPELALRGALGATRGSIVRQLLIEGLILSLAGSAGGLILTGWTIQAFKQIGPAQFPRLEGISLDPAVVLFALAAAGVTTVISRSPPRSMRRAATSPPRTVRCAPSRGPPAPPGQRALVIARSPFRCAASGAALSCGVLRLVAIDPGFTA